MSIAFSPGWCGLVHLFGQQDRSSAGAEGGFGVNEVVKPGQALRSEELEKRARFTARNNEAVDGVELFKFADEDDLRPEFFEAEAVGVVVALQCEDTNGGAVSCHSLNAIRLSLFAFRRRALSEG